MSDIELDWNNVANEAATAFGAALGGQLGAVVGEAIGQMIFGAATSDDPFKSEVRDALKLINEKLDTIISWMHNFPELLQRELTAARVAELKVLVEVETDRVFSELQTYASYSSPTAEQARTLANSGQQTISVAQQLMGTDGVNAETYLSAMACFVVGASALLRAARKDRALMKALSWRAATTSIKYLSPRLQPRADGKSFRDALNRINTAGPIAVQFTDHIFNASKEFLLSWEKNENFGPNAYFESGCWLAILPDGRLMGDTLGNWTTIPNFNPATDLSKFRFKVSPYWIPIESPGRMAHYNELVQRTYGAIAEAKRYKSHQPALAQAVSALESYKLFLDIIAAASPQEITQAIVSVKPEEHLTNAMMPSGKGG